LIYRALCCPKCGFQIFDARTVRYLTAFTKKMCWMLSTVELVNLQQEYRRIREAVAKGMDVEQVLAWTTQYEIKGDIAS